MTLQELADQINETLKEHPGYADLEIVCQADAEGNSYRTMAGIDMDENYHNGEYNLEVYSLEDALDTFEDIDELTRCAVIWPC
jgi:hypothetical protein